MEINHLDLNLSLHEQLDAMGGDGDGEGGGVDQSYQLWCCVCWWSNYDVLYAGDQMGKIAQHLNHSDLTPLTSCCDIFDGFVDADH